MSATNRGAKRKENDFYPTPYYSIDSIANELDHNLAKSIRWGEPAAGDSSIIYRLSNRLRIEPNVWEWAELKEGLDFLENGMTGYVDAIITNPPYSLAQEFVDKALDSSKFCAMLLRLNFLGSQKRKKWWNKKEPTHCFVLSKRPSFSGKGTDATEYAWFVWDKIGLCIKDPGIYVI